VENAEKPIEISEMAARFGAAPAPGRGARIAPEPLTPRHSRAGPSTDRRRGRSQEIGVATGFGAAPSNERRARTSVRSIGASVH
jgi:hypothetical protein